MLRRIGTSAVVLSALAIGLTLAGAIFAAKPGGGGSAPPAGTIFYHDGDEIWGMKGDGSGKTRVFTGGIRGEPSGKVYGTNPITDRYWLKVLEVGDGNFYPDARKADGSIFPGRPRKELYAFHADGTVVQVTNLFPCMEPDDQPYQAYHKDRWSNDDSFVSCLVLDYTDILRDDDGDGIFDRIDSEAVGFNYAHISYILRLNVSGTQIDAPGFEPVAFPEDAALMDLISAKSSLSGASFAPDTNGDYDWSPDGLKVVISRPSEGLLMVRQLDGTTSNILVWGTPQIPRGAENPRWAADGSVISFHHFGDIYTIDPTGAGGPKLMIAPSGSSGFRRARWSPDSQFWALQKAASSAVASGSYQEDQWVYRYKRDGKGGTNLTATLDKTVTKEPIRWVSD